MCHLSPAAAAAAVDDDAAPVVDVGSQEGLS